ncbi:YopT-type cysteine protease domain-containing protein [Paracidovorax citrulli]|nr:YopT-type cysteine protease domain-containing protein [Paracidovorax citrulli]
MEPAASRLLQDVCRRLRSLCKCSRPARPCRLPGPTGKAPAPARTLRTRLPPATPAHQPTSPTFSASSSSSGIDSPPRVSTSVFAYQTAELEQANVEGICVGLVTEWLRRPNQSPSGRMAALARDTPSHAQAALRQQKYQQDKDALRAQGMGAADADMRAQNGVLREAGLRPADNEDIYRSDALSDVARAVSTNGTRHLLGLYFTDGTAHTVATSAAGGKVTLFDPNFGEFEAPPRRMGGLMQSLSNRYERPNGHILMAVSVQSMH